MPDPGRTGPAAPIDPPSPEVEATLVRHLKAGNEDALEALLGLYWDGLLRFALRILEDRDGAEDVVQEAFVRLWTRRSEWERDDTLRPVLYRIVRNAALNAKRRHSTFRRWARTLAPSPRDPAPSPLQSVESSELEELVHRAVDDLPERRKEIFLLVRFHDMSYREAGEALEISPQTVANQMSQAMTDLRQAMAPHLERDGFAEIPFPRARTG